MERCPICRARYKNDPLCYRCGSDLSKLLQIGNEAEALQLQAIILLKKNQRSAAQDLVKRALALKYNPLTAALTNFLAADLTFKEDDYDDEQYYLVQERDL